ncbi:hypothetical protein [Runella sp.]|uniref:hypothetical protein n=1 Tax=Runella sp. TaxID=1960881 RepID=UPI003D09B2C0
MQFPLLKSLLPGIVAVVVTQISHAQRVVASDSLPLFYSTADETGGAGVPSILKTKGRVTHLALTPEGTITVSAFRQTIGYLDATPTKGVPLAPNALPGMVQYRYEPATGLQQISEGIFNINGGLRQPISYKLFDIISNRGTINNKTPLATSESGLDYLNTLATQPRTLLYEGERKIIRRIFVREGVLRYQTQTQYYTPYSAAYLVSATNERELAPLRTKTAYIIDQTHLQVLLRDGNQVRLLDTTGKGLTVPLPIDKDMFMRAENTYLESSGNGFNNVGNFNAELGIDLVFGPAFISKTQDSSFVFVRVDKQGTVVCKYRFKIPVEAGFTGAVGTWIIGNEKESILHIEFGKGLFKTVAFNVKINVEKGVVYVKEESKEDQRKARIAAASISKQFYHLVSLSNGDNLAVSVNSTSTTGDDHYGTVHLSADGILKNYYVHNRLAFRSQLFVARVPQCITLKDGRILLITDEPWGSSVPYQPYGNLDLELAADFTAQVQSLGEPDKPNLHFNASTLQRSQNKINNSKAVRLFNTLDRLSGPDPRLTGKEYTDKRQIQTESQEYITSPVMYLIDPLKGSAETVKVTYGSVIPYQPYAFYDHNKGELHFLLRSHPAGALRTYKGTLMQGVFLKSFKVDLNK